MKTLIPLAALLMCLVAGSHSQGTAPLIRVSEDIEIFRITAHSYVYVSYFELPPWGRVPSNGLVHISDGEALLFDTPMSDSQTKTLVRWITDSLRVTIKGLIANHWHKDCIGGLKYIKSIGIPSYANEKTIATARRRGLPVPEHSFRDSLTVRVGRDVVVSRYFGAAHTTDNIVSWIPSEQILFGGCMVRELSATTAGNTADADLAAWPLTIERVRSAYPAAEIVIPGHGAIGGTDLLRHTKDLFTKTK
jgi:metallo-beta-lactamase class B